MQDTSLSATTRFPPQFAIQMHNWLPDFAFVFVLALGAFLRLWRIDATQFLNDSAGTFGLAHDVLTLHGLPVTGIAFSIGSFSPPGSVYIYMLPSLIGSPTLGAAETALANIAAIALTYYLCRRYLNAVIGLVTTLLFSVSSGSVTYSRFIWPPNFQTPFVVLLIMSMIAGIAGHRKGWLAWALPFLAILIQMHPVTAALVPLLIISWLLVPETVKVRDLAIGCALATALFMPTIVFEVTTGFADLQVYRRVASSTPVTSATVLHRFLDINSLIQTVPWADTHTYFVLNVTWEVLLVCGLSYVTLRVIVPFLRQVSHPAVAANWRDRIITTLDWMRAEAQARWRIDFVLLMWPVLILGAQIRHTSPIETHYVIATFPAQFLAVGILLHDLGYAIPRLQLKCRLTAISTLVLCIALLVTVCVTQAVGITSADLGLQPRSLEAEEVDLTQALHLALQYHVALVAFQPDYWAIEPTHYLLQTRYEFPVPTQIMASGACLAGAPAGDNAVLYLMSGDQTSWETILTQIPGVHNLLERGAGFFRAYVVTPEEISQQFKPFGSSVRSAPVQFSDTIAEDNIWRAPVPGQPSSALVVQAHILSKPSVAPFHRMYGLSATLRGNKGQTLATGNMFCNISPWIPQQRIYYLLPQVAVANTVRDDTLLVSAAAVTYSEADPSIGPLRLITAYDLATIQYLAPPTDSQTFPATLCKGIAVCQDADSAIIPLR